MTDSGDFNKEPLTKSVRFAPTVERTVIPIDDEDDSSDSSSDSSSSSDSNPSLTDAEKQIVLTEEV